MFWAQKQSGSGTIFETVKSKNIPLPFDDEISVTLLTLSCQSRLKSSASGPAGKWIVSTMQRKKMRDQQNAKEVMV